MRNWYHVVVLREKDVEILAILLNQREVRFRAKPPTKSSSGSVSSNGGQTRYTDKAFFGNLFSEDTLREKFHQESCLSNKMSSKERNVALEKYLPIPIFCIVL